MKQKVIISTSVKEQLSELWKKHGIKKILLVCDSAFEYLQTRSEYLELEIPYVVFNRFTSNPLYEDVVEGVKVLRENGCDAILAIGGGSAIDVAKCVKLFSSKDDSKLYLQQKFAENDVMLFAIPTTSGTGSESTRYAVIYYEGQKQSVTHESIIPAYAILDYRNLMTLPKYQKKCTMMDALCQSIESWWSVNATAESKEYAKRALNGILENMDAYMENTEAGNKAMLVAANYAGRAINISQTTAAHAMSYKLTSIYKIPHGRAVFMCLPYIWNYMWEELQNECDKKQESLREIFVEIAQAMGNKTVPQAIEQLFVLNQKYFKDEPVQLRMEDAKVLAASVNPTRLSNNPMMLSEETLYGLYTAIIQDYQ